MLLKTMSEIALIGFVQSLFFSVLIITKKHTEKKDVVLLLFLLFAAAELIYRYLTLTTGIENNLWLVLFDIFYWALFGPLTLIYILLTTNTIKRLSPVHLLNLLPLLAGLIGIRDLYFGGVYYHSFAEYFNNSVGFTKQMLFVWDNASPVYLLFAFAILTRHKKRVRNFYTNIAQKDLQWLFWLVSGFLIYLLFSYTLLLMYLLFDVTTAFSSLHLLPAMLTAYVFILGYFGYKQEGVFYNHTKAEIDSIVASVSENELDKYAKTGLDEAERAEIIQSLTSIMETEKPYIECDLNLADLAKKLNTTTHKLSRVINESFDQNFYDFVNFHRINEVVDLMKKPENKNYTIMSLAYDCGFSSKSAFYNAFRKNKGTTPGNFLQKEIPISD